MPPVQRSPTQAASAGGDGAQAVHAHPGGQRSQRAIDMRVAGGDPGKAGEEHTARQFGQQPQRGQEQRVSGWPCRAASAATGRHRSGQVRATGMPPAPSTASAAIQAGKPAVAVHADEQPPGAGHQPGRAEQADRSVPRGAAWRGAAGAPARARPRRGHLQPPRLGVHVGQRCAARPAPPAASRSAQRPTRAGRGGPSGAVGAERLFRRARHLEPAHRAAAGEHHREHQRADLRRTRRAAARGPARARPGRRWCRIARPAAARRRRR